MRCVRGREVKSGQVKVRMGRRVGGPVIALDARPNEALGQVAYAWMNQA